MPNGWRRPDANSSTRSGPASRSAPRTTLTRPAADSTTNTSPLGAVRIMRGSLTLVVSRSTTKPSGTRGSAPAGRRTIAAPLSADGVAYGAGRSSGVSLRRTPGASVVQSPIAARPVRTAGAAGASSGGGAPTASVDASRPAIAGARESADRMPALYRDDRTDDSRPRDPRPARGSPPRAAGDAPPVHGRPQGTAIRGFPHGCRQTPACVASRICLPADSRGSVVHGPAWPG